MNHKQPTVNKLSKAHLLDADIRAGARPWSSSYSRSGWWLFVCLAVTWLLWLTLRPDRTPNDINLIPLAEHSSALVCLLDSTCLFQRQAFWFLLVDVLGNIIVFMPLGFGLAGALHRAWVWQTIGRAALAGFLLSLIIELIQLTIPSRATDVDDLIFNTLGTILGVFFYLTLSLGTNRLQKTINRYNLD